jgi:Alcohol dehydrogenase GroES-like domain
MNGDWPLPLPMVLGHEAAGIVVENGPGVDNVKPGDHVIFSFRPHCGRCRYCSSGQTVLCIGHNDTPRWRMHDGTARVKLNGEPVNQMARIGTFSEEVVCPAEQVVKVPRRPAVYPCGDHRLQRRDRDRRGDPPCAGRGRLERAGDRVRRGRAQCRSGRPARRGKSDHRLRSARQQARLCEEFRCDLHGQRNRGERRRTGAGDDAGAGRRLRL